MRFPTPTTLVVACLLGCGPTSPKVHQTGEFPLDIAVTPSRVWLLTQTYDSMSEQNFGLVLYYFDSNSFSRPIEFARTTLPESAGVPQAMFSASLTSFTATEPGVINGFGYFYKKGYQAIRWVPNQGFSAKEITGFESEVAWRSPNPLVRADETKGLLWFGQAYLEPADIPLIDFQEGKVVATHQVATCNSDCTVEKHISLKDVSSRLGTFSFFAECSGRARYLVTNSFAVAQPITENTRIDLSDELVGHLSSPGRLFCGALEKADGLWIDEAGGVYSFAISEGTVTPILTISPVPKSPGDVDRTGIVASHLAEDRWLIAAAVATDSFELECSEWFASCASGEYHSFGLTLLDIDTKGIRRQQDLF